MFSLRIVILAATLAAVSLALSAILVLAADPTPGPGLLDPLDPRAGGGASRVGAPLLALLTTLVIGAVALAATAIYVRLGRQRR